MIEGCTNKTVMNTCRSRDKENIKEWCRNCLIMEIHLFRQGEDQRRRDAIELSFRRSPERMGQ